MGRADEDWAEGMLEDFNNKPSAKEQKPKEKLPDILVISTSAYIEELTPDRIKRAGGVDEFLISTVSMNSNEIESIVTHIEENFKGKKITFAKSVGHYGYPRKS